MQEHQCDITAEIRGELSQVVCYHQNLLDALTDGDKVVELINGESLVSVRPFIIYQYHIVKPKTLFRHIEKPHAHRTWPHHQAYELGVTVYRVSRMPIASMTFNKTHQIDLNEKTPIC